MSMAPDPESGDIVYSRMRWNTPLSVEHADMLLDRLELTAGTELLDLGCGWGELLIRAVAGVAGTTGTGVDSDEWALERGRRSAAERSVLDRIAFVDADASTWTGRADRIICVGASHAWGGASGALRTLQSSLRPQGRLLFGDGYWERSPSPAAIDLFGRGVLTLDALVDEALRTGWRVLHVSTADQREWDEFESSWRAGRSQWVLSHPDDARAPEIRARVDDQLREYVQTYRGLLGFAYLVLAP
jgi:cyclopropane fatty-acyl-phospholipid synthase-like methyltransferase